MTMRETPFCKKLLTLTAKSNLLKHKSLTVIECAGGGVLLEIAMPAQVALAQVSPPFKGVG